MDYRIISIGVLSRHELWPEPQEPRTPHATTTLVRSGERMILVDPGLPPQVITARLHERSGLKASDITHIFLTNFRPAHRWGLPAFPGATWWISEGEREAIGTGLIEAFKRELFTLDERREMIGELLAECCSNAEVRTYTGLTVDFAREVGATVILRGLRNVLDLHHEFQLALTNRALADIETIFIMSGETYGFTSSSLIKQIALGGEIDRMHRLLPGVVIERLKEKKRERAGVFAEGVVDGFRE